MDSLLPLMSVEFQDNYILVKLLKEIDVSSANDVKKGFIYLIEHVDRNVQLDLSHLNKLDSSCIGAIAFLFKRLQSLDFSLEVTGLKDDDMALIRELHLINIIHS